MGPNSARPKIVETWRALPQCNGKPNTRKNNITATNVQVTRPFHVFQDITAEATGGGGGGGGVIGGGETPFSCRISTTTL